MTRSYRGSRWSLPVAIGLVVSTALTVTVAGTAQAASAPTTTVVDSFATAAALTSAAGGTVTGADQGPAAGLVGGVRRDILTTSGGGALSTATVDGVPGLTFATPGGSAGSAELVYDGSAAPSAIDPTGLGGIDLTDGGTHTGVAAAVGASLPGVVVRLTVLTDATHCSTISAPVGVAADPGAGSQAVLWRFTDLTPAAGCTSPADPTNVGALAITFDDSAAPGATVTMRNVRSATADWGDLPSAWGETTAAEGGAAAIVDPTLRLGSLLAGKPDGVHSAGSSADPDDDGVTLTRGLTWAPGSPTDSPAAGGALDVSVTGTGCLSVWLGLAPGTDLGAAGDEVVAGQAVTSGTRTVRFALPAGFTLPSSVVARARLFPRDRDGTCTAEEPLDGVSDAGEVEDYVIAVTPAPVAPGFTVVPASPSPVQAPTWAFTQPPGTTETCQVTDSRGAVLAAATACAGFFTARLPQVDGSYTLTVIASDAQGRVSPPAVASYTLDTAPPASPVITAAPATPSNADQPAWQFSDPDQATTECQLVYGSGTTQTVVRDFHVCTSPDPADLTGRPDGTYTFSVEAVDPAGNVSAIPTSSLVRDTTPPGVPGFGATPPAVSSSTSPSWSFTRDGDAHTECRLTGGTLPGAFTACASPYVGSLDGQPDGTYTFDVRAIDAAGNASATASATTTLDTTAPTAVVTAAPPSPVSASSLRWSVTAGDPGATLECTLSAVLASGSSTVAGPADCSGTVTYSVAGRPDGDYILSVQATDAAGNVGPVATSDVVVDRTAPAVPVIGPLAATTRDPQLSWSFTADPTAVVFCSLSGADGAQSPVPCTSPSSYDLSRRADGAYTFSVYAEDQAGNRSAPATSTVTLDRTPPGLGITASPASPGQTRKPTWSFSTDAGTTSQCRLDLGTTNVFPFGPCSSPFSPDLSGDPDGAYVFSVRSQDAAGNVAGPVSSTYLLDTTAPSPPTILEPPVTPSNNRSPSWTFASEAGSLQSCRLLNGSANADGSGVTLLDWQPCAGSFTASLRTEPDGPVTFQVRAQDAAGNVSAAADSPYVLDTFAATPVITVPPASPGRATDVSWAFSLSSDELAECRLVRAGAVLRAFRACASPVAEDLTGLTDGEVDLQIQATDGAGNTSGLAVSSYVLDTTAPAVPVFTGSPTTPGSTRSPAWDFTGPDDGSASCRSIQNDVALTSWQPCAGSASVDLTGLVDGSYALQVRETDNAGNVSATVTSQRYVLITQPPAAPTITATPGPGGPAQSVSWQVSVPAGDLVQCRLDDAAAVVSEWVPCPAPASFAVTGIPDGTLLFSARAVDAAGGIGPTAASAFVLDRTPPTTPLVTDQQGKSGANGVVSWDFTADPGTQTSCEVTRSTGEVVSPWRPCTGNFALDLTARGSGSYTFSVRAADTWGNVSVASQSDYAYQAPVLPAQTQVVTPGTPGFISAGKPLLAPVSVVLPAVNADLEVRPAKRAPGIKTIVTPAQPRGPPAAAPVPKQPPSVAVRPLPGPPLSPSRVFRDIVSGARDHVALPLVLIVLVLLFLAVQDRLDRGDPKLALAPGAGRDDYAEFR